MIAALKDYERQLATIKERGYVSVVGSDGSEGRYLTPVFVPEQAGLPGDVGGDAWSDAAASAQVAEAQ